MPNAKVLSEKKKIVEELTEKLKSPAGVLVDYSGITVNEDTEMRVKLREAKIDYSVVKNTLMRFAIKNVGFEELDPVLNGTTSLAISYDDPIAPARVIKEYVDKLSDYFEIKGGFMDGKVLSVSEVNALAAIPPIPILRAQLLGTMLAPIISLAVVLKAIAEKNDTPVVETAAEAAKEPVVETPTEATEEPTVETPTEATEEPAVETAAEATEVPEVETAAEAAKEPEVETAAETAEEPAVETPTEATEEPTVETAAETAEEPVVETPTEVTEEPVVETPTEAAEEPEVETDAAAIDEPADDATKTKK